MTPPAERTAAAAPRAPGATSNVLIVSAILLCAVLLRIWRLHEGLPDFTEEAYPLRRGFEMAGWETGRPDWNPRAFHYPSLALYLHAALQWLQFGIGSFAGVYGSAADYFVAWLVDPTPMVMAARGLGVACDLAILLGTIAISERVRRGAGWFAAALLALSPTLIRETRLVHVDAPMAALAVWSLERMLRARETGGMRPLAMAALLAGLAAGTKYGAALLAIPLAWTAWQQRLPARAWLGLAAIGLASFFITSPFLPFELGRVSDSARVIGDLLGSGQLGSFGTATWASYLAQLCRDPGWIALALAVASPWLVGRERAGTLVLPGLFALVFLAPAMLGQVAFPRYLVPALPAIALLAALGAFGLLDRLRVPAAARGAALAAVVVPLAMAGWSAAAAGPDTTQARARRWLEAAVADTALVVQEKYAAALRTCPEVARAMRSPAFARAGNAWLGRYHERRTLHGVTLPLLVAGRAAVVARDGTSLVDVFPNTSDLNQVFYHPSLYGAVDWFVTSEAVRGRYLADTIRYARQHRLYALLDAHADSVARFESGPGVAGPGIRIYRLGERWRGAVREADGALDPLWWARDVPEESRRALGAAAAPAPAEPGMPEPWIRSLGPMFDRTIAPFAFEMAGHLSELGRASAERAFVDAILAVGDPSAATTRAARAADQVLPPR